VIGILSRGKRSEFHTTYETIRLIMYGTFFFYLYHSADPADKQRCYLVPTSEFNPLVKEAKRVLSSAIM
jgi:hypothetical protein